MAALIPYQDRFEYGIVITNGTYIPKQSILDTMRQLPYPFMVRVDNYGQFSTKYDEVVAVLKQNQIKVDERTYTGDDQAFGGWVYYGDYTDKQYSEEQLNDVFRRCRLPHDGAILYNDELTNCCYSTAGQMLGKVSMSAREIVKLSAEQSMAEMREKVAAWRERPFEACKYCNGFDPINSPRCPAAEQLT